MNCSPEIALRPASPADEDFLYVMSRSTRGAHVLETYGEWDESDQRARFASRDRRELDQVIEVAGERIGCVAIDWCEDHAYIVRVFIAPDLQRRGIGSRLVRDVLVRADRLGVPVCLKVLKVNPAVRFWQRLGFAISGETDTHWAMERPVSSTGPALEQMPGRTG